MMLKSKRQVLRRRIAQLVSLLWWANAWMSNPFVARGDLVIDLPEVTVFGDGVNPTTGMFEVQLTLTGGDLTSPPLISSYNLDFSVSSPDIVFDTSSSAFVSANPLLMTSMPSEFNFDSTNSTAQTVRVFVDIYDKSPSSKQATDGAGLLKVSFTVAAGQFGTYPVEFGPLNEVANQAAIALPLTLNGGSITVSAIPEVTAWAAMLLAVITASTISLASRLTCRM